MRLKEIKIDRYGPLPPIHWHLNEGIQVVYGPNESGKTLIVEALLKMFVGEKVTLPKEMDRTSEKPEGYLLFDDSGSDIKLERGETLSEHLSIEHEDVKNIFVVRNTDLKIESEDLFYDRVTDRLTGSRTKDIQRITKKLREIGRLTEKLKISDKGEEHSKADSQLQKAKKLKEEIKNYIQKAEKNGIRDLETKKLELETKEAEQRKKINILKVKKLSNAFNIAQSKSKKLEIIPISEIQTLKKGLEETELDESKCLRLRRDEIFYRRLCYASIIGCAITLAALIFMGLIFNSNSLILGGALWIILPISLFLHHRTNCNLEDTELKLKSTTNKLKNLGLKAGSIKGVKKEIDEIEKRVKDLGAVLHQNIGILKDGLGIRSESAEKVLEMAKIELKKLQETQGLVKVTSYHKSELEKAERTHKEITEELNQLETSLNEHNNALQEFSRSLNEINFRGFLNIELDLIIENLEALQQLSKHLESFTIKIEEDANLSRIAIKIFEQLELEEGKKISKLFGVNSRASEIFRELTEGRYTKIDYDPEKKLFVTSPSGKILYPSKELSGSRGAVDQLYLAIRIALGYDILKEKKGFFILDDPFVFSDEDRENNELNLLRKLSEMGWQVLYFTAKRSTSKLISQITGNKTIELDRIPLE